jgi:nucleoid-associated protein YgaU
MHLRDRTAAAPFWTQVNATMTGWLVLMIPIIASTVDNGTPPATVGGGSYTVVSGDNLHVIAARTLGDPLRWREIYVLNRTVIGSNPDLIHPGQVLELPLP